MTGSFFERPILNSPYGYPGRHWEFVDGQPINRIIELRRHSDLITPVPKPKRRSGRVQAKMCFPGRFLLEYSVASRRNMMPPVLLELLTKFDDKPVSPSGGSLLVRRWDHFSDF